MLRTVRSELIRMRRRSFVLGWLGLTALMSVMISAFVFTAAGEGTQSPSAAPGGSFPTAADLTRPDGFVASLGSASTLLGVVTLSFWAIAAASDYSTGLIRLLVQAEPHRVRLLAGKVLALAGWTAAATTTATALSVLVSPAAAKAAGLSTRAWDTGVGEAAGTVAGAWLNAFLALLVWGVIGLVIAVVARSSALAIACGVGYVLVVEGIVGLVAEDLSDRLPGATLTALAGGGSDAVGYGTAVGLGLAYATIGLAAAAVTFVRRDISD